MVQKNNVLRAYPEMCDVTVVAGELGKKTQRVTAQREENCYWKSAFRSWQAIKGFHADMARHFAGLSERRRRTKLAGRPGRERSGQYQSQRPFENQEPGPADRKGQNQRQYLRAWRIRDNQFCVPPWPGSS